MTTRLGRYGPVAAFLLLAACGYRVEIVKVVPARVVSTPTAEAPGAPAIFGAPYNLSNGDSLVVQAMATTDGASTPVCIVRRLALAADPATLDRDVLKRLRDRNSRIAPDPLAGVDTAYAGSVWRAVFSGAGGEDLPAGTPPPEYPEKLPATDPAGDSVDLLPEPDMEEPVIVTPEPEEPIEADLEELDVVEPAGPAEPVVAAMQDILTPAEASAAFDCVYPEIVETMSTSPHVLARAYSGWKRVDNTPFFRGGLGGRYLAVFANGRTIGEDGAGAFLDRGIQIGGVLATPGFVVSPTGVVAPGPLVLVEKMTRGYTTAYGNYRYTILDAAGRVRAVTNGANREKIALCDRCTDHGADRLYISLLNDGVAPAGLPEPEEAPRPVYEPPPETGSAPASDAYKTTDVGGEGDGVGGEFDPFADDLGGELNPNADFLAPLDPELETPDIDLDPSVDLLAPDS